MICRPGGFSTSSLTYHVLILLVAAFLIGVIEIGMYGQAHVPLPRPLEEHGIPQREPAESATTASTTAANRLGNHYLMLVNTAMANQMDAPKLAQFDRSPYDGLAVSFLNAYDTSPLPSPALMEAQIA